MRDRQASLVVRTALAAAACAAVASLAHAVDIPGVEQSSFSQPFINTIVSDPATGVVLPGPDEGYFIPNAFLDTGASGIVLSATAADLLGLEPIKTGPNNEPVLFGDVGVGGTEMFYVSQPVDLATGNFHDFADVEDPAYYTNVTPDVRVQIRQEDPESPFGGPLQINVIGMPAMIGRVTVFDPKPTNAINHPSSYIYAPGTPFRPDTADRDPGIPQTSHTVRLSFGDFSDYVFVDPAGAPGPTFTHNPFIGPNPLAPSVPGEPPPVRISRTAGQQTLESEGSWLLDTGASVSILSEARAGELDVHVFRADTDGDGQPDGSPVLLDGNGQPVANQFSVALGGIGGESRDLAGFYLSKLVLPTTDPNDPIVFLNAPVVVGDITLLDENDVPFTLDGVFGMNHVMASFAADGNGMFMGGAAPSWFNWMVFDEPNGLLGLDVNYPLLNEVPEPGVGALVAAAFASALLRRRRTRASA